MGLIFTREEAILDESSEQEVRDRATAKILCNHIKEFNKLVDEIRIEMLEALTKEMQNA